MLLSTLLFKLPCGYTSAVWLFTMGNLVRCRHVHFKAEGVRMTGNFAGRSEEESARFQSVMDEKTGVLLRLICEHVSPPASILIVGCGSGIEAGLFARFFNCHVIGIDIGADYEFQKAAAAPADLLMMDARSMTFADETFDLVYSFHALEHIQGYRKALAEMSRVLKRTGSYCVGTPNSERLVGYVQTAEPFANKVRYNLRDLYARLRGRWQNELGAHAGFSRTTLLSDCMAAFGAGTDVSEAYYLSLYPRHAALIRALLASGLARWIFPSVYIIGSKHARS
jgi:SAM-dependent methyltransferase